jgi:hypothetical protein
MYVLVEERLISASEAGRRMAVECLAYLPSENRLPFERHRVENLELPLERE